MSKNYSQDIKSLLNEFKSDPVKENFDDLSNLYNKMKGDAFQKLDKAFSKKYIVLDIKSKKEAKDDLEREFRKLDRLMEKLSTSDDYEAEDILKLSESFDNFDNKNKSARSKQEDLSLKILNQYIDDAKVDFEKKQEKLHGKSSDILELDYDNLHENKEFEEFFRKKLEKTDPAFAKDYEEWCRQQERKLAQYINITDLKSIQDKKNKPLYDKVVNNFVGSVASNLKGVNKSDLIKIVKMGLIVGNLPQSLVVKAAFFGLQKFGVLDKIKDSVVDRVNKLKKDAMDPNGSFWKSFAKRSALLFVAVSAAGGLMMAGDALNINDYLGIGDNSNQQSIYAEDGVNNDRVAFIDEVSRKVNSDSVDTIAGVDDNNEPNDVDSHEFTNADSNGKPLEVIRDIDSANQAELIEDAKNLAEKPITLIVNGFNLEFINDFDSDGVTNRYESYPHLDIHGSHDSHDSVLNSDIGESEGGNFSDSSEGVDSKDVLSNQEYNNPELLEYVGEKMPQNNYWGKNGSMSILAKMNGLSMDDINNLSVGQELYFPTQDENGVINGFDLVVVGHGDTISDLYESHRYEELRGYEVSPEKAELNSSSVSDEGVVANKYDDALNHFNNLMDDPDISMLDAHRELINHEEYRAAVKDVLREEFSQHKLTDRELDKLLEGRSLGKRSALYSSIERASKGLMLNPDFMRETVERIYGVNEDKPLQDKSNILKPSGRSF